MSRPYAVHGRWYAINQAACRYSCASLKQSRLQAGIAYTLARKGTRQGGSSDARRLALNGTLDPLARTNKMRAYRAQYYRARNVIIWIRKEGR